MSGSDDGFFVEAESLKKHLKGSCLDASCLCILTIPFFSPALCVRINLQQPVVRVTSCVLHGAVEFLSTSGSRMRTSLLSPPCSVCELGRGRLTQCCSTTAVFPFHPVVHGVIRFSRFMRWPLISDRTSKRLPNSSRKRSLQVLGGLLYRCW